MRRNYSDVDKNRIMELHHGGWTATRIAKGYGVSPSAIRGLIGRMKRKVAAGSDAKSNNHHSVVQQMRSERDEAAVTLEKERAERAKEQVVARRQIEQLMEERNVIPHKFDGDKIKLGIVADPHLGSIYEVPGLLDAAFDKFEEEDVHTVYLPGDLLEGMYRHRRDHVYEVKPGMWSCDAQVDYALNIYPRRDGIITRFIIGNHDYTFIREVDVNIGKRIAKEREDMEYLGLGEAVIELEGSNGTAKLMLSHPDDSISAYSLSYKPQRWIEAITGGHKPHILITGHYHKYFSFFYRNIHATLPGSIQPQSRWMRDKRISVMTGFCIIEITLNDIGVVEHKIAFYPDFN
jgi:transposase-like protein